jgi:hypothetical protein
MRDENFLAHFQNPTIVGRFAIHAKVFLTLSFDCYGKSSDQVQISTFRWNFPSFMLTTVLLSLFYF